MDIWNAIVVTFWIIVVAVPLLIIFAIVSTVRQHRRPVVSAVFLKREDEQITKGVTRRAIIGDLAMGPVGAVVGAMSAPTYTKTTFSFKVTWEDGKETVEACPHNSYDYHRYVSYLTINDPQTVFSFNLKCDPNPLITPGRRLQLKLNGSAEVDAPDGRYMGRLPKEYARTAEELRSCGWIVVADVEAVAQEGKKLNVSVRVSEGPS